MTKQLFGWQPVEETSSLDVAMTPDTSLAKRQNKQPLVNLQLTGRTQVTWNFAQYPLTLPCNMCSLLLSSRPVDMCCQAGTISPNAYEEHTRHEGRGQADTRSALRVNGGHWEQRKERAS
ncbi:unnamed protein product [Protopolystoma xenopodis]|uniref:Uncharacterized protein n=1 Tax=Protopolystoma xenopodis TaxID=117903 RepID=A0A3S5C907_9PLAT|nr:unnamed protein product [Protopolystoma xenopodis]